MVIVAFMKKWRLFLVGFLGFGCMWGVVHYTVLESRPGALVGRIAGFALIAAGLGAVAGVI